MPTNEVRRELLNRAKASGYPGSITEVFQAADQGIDLIEQHQMQEQQQQMQVAQTPQEQEVGLREQHAMGNTNASMAFPDVQPGQSFNTVGMQAPIDIQKIDDQGHLVESYKNVPPGIQDLPTGPSEGTIIESPAAYRKGGVRKYQSGGTKFYMGREGNLNCIPGTGSGCGSAESALQLKPNFGFTYNTKNKYIGAEAGANLQTYIGGLDTRSGAPIIQGGIRGGYSVNPYDANLQAQKTLEATGRLPEGVKAQYSNENGNIRAMQDGTNYRMILRAKNGENIHVEFAEVLDKSRVNSEKGGYNFLQSKGTDVTTETPLEEMNVLELATLAKENNYSKDFKIGMYNISGSDLRTILEDLQRNDPTGSFLNRKFDQDLQDELIFLLYRSKLNQTKTLQGATAQTWAQTFNVPIELAKELMDIYPLLKDTPYMQLQHLIPDAIPVLQEALAGQ